MAFSYTKVLRQAGLRIGAIKGVTAAALATAYGTSPLVEGTHWVSADFPFQSAKDALVGIVGDLKSAYANVENHPFRAFGLSQTANITSGAAVPSVDSTDKSIIGLRGAVRDAATGKAMTEQPLQLIENINSNTDTFLKGDYNYFKYVGDRLYHTKTNAVIDVVTFDVATEETAIAANGNVSLPDALYAPCWVGLVGVLVVDDEFATQAALHTQYYENVKAAIRGGATTFPAAPTLVNTREARVS